MQNNNKSKGFRSFVKEKGYYIVLLLCAAAVGTSGYFLLTRDKTPVTPEATVQTEVPASSIGNAPTQKAANAVATQGAEPTEPTSPKRLVTVRPSGGETVTSFAADHLAYNETTRDWRTHEGVDFRAEADQSVTAAADGTVYAIYEDQSYGMTVVLQHTDGYTTHYANLSEDVPVTVGQSVRAGETVGTVGDTACVETAMEPHLHFAVYKNNQAVDPAEFFN
ncbi:MAG: hypothetical protein CW335_04050 [Clostridiales bacterium]|nr:hypothetical protein [Clostridiales bacterium]